MLVNERWIPRNKQDYPVSQHSSKTRCWKPSHLERFTWLAVSACEDMTGAWCVYCVLFGSSMGVGRGGRGRLVAEPLTHGEGWCVGMSRKDAIPSHK